MTIMPQCMDCKHFFLGSGKGGGTLRCEAFPTEPGIPQPILIAKHDHRNAYPGDRGIRFEEGIGIDRTLWQIQEVT